MPHKDPEVNRAYQRKWHREAYRRKRAAREAAKATADATLQSLTMRAILQGLTDKDFRKLHGLDRGAAKTLHIHRERAIARGCHHEHVSVDDWRAILECFAYRCAYCGNLGKMTIEHVYPIDLGGSHTKDNLVPACTMCNGSKWNRGPLRMVNVPFRSMRESA